MRTDSVGVPKDSDDIDSTKAEPPGCCANPCRGFTMCRIIKVAAT